MKRKICHITSAHPRYDIRIFEKECKSLAKNEFEVYLLVNDDRDNEILDGVNIISTKFKPKNRLDRFMNAYKRILEKALEIDADIYHIHDPDLLPLGNKLKRLGKKVIFDSHEDVPVQIMDKEWIPKIIRSIISKLYEYFERNSVKKYDAVISVTPHIVERFSKINSNSIMVTNYPIVDPNEKILRNPSNAICFAGGISEQWNHDKIILAIEKIKDIKYILAGSGKNEYLDTIKGLPGWSKVDYRGKIPHLEVKNVYSQSLVGIALNCSKQAKGEGTLGNTKLFEFMAAGLPIICTDYKLWKEIIENNQCGICVNPSNMGEIIQAIEYLIKNPDITLDMGKRGYEAAVEKYNWKTQEKKLLTLYMNII